jgi:hypothetical protein
MRKKEGPPVKNSVRFAFAAILFVSAASFVMAAPITPMPMPQMALSAPITPMPMPQMALSAPITPMPMPQ